MHYVSNIFPIFSESFQGGGGGEGGYCNDRFKFLLPREEYYIISPRYWTVLINN